MDARLHHWNGTEWVESGEETPLPVANVPIEMAIRLTQELLGCPASIYTIHGYRRQWSSTSVLGDLAAYLVGGQAKINAPAVATTYYLNSTSAQDLTAGSGVDRVQIYYLDSAGNEQLMAASLNGTTAVSLGNGFSAIQWMVSYHSVTADRVAVGAITISSVNGVATESTTMEMIRAGGNRSESFRFTVPTGKKALLIDYHVSTAKTGAAATFDTKLRGLSFMYDDAISNAYHFIKVVSMVDGVSFSEDLHYRKFPAGSVIKLSVIPSAAGDGTIVSGGMDFILKDA
ncbi:MAG: hypothetical protein WC073_11305 [Sterolibacterium sp.]